MIGEHDGTITGPVTLTLTIEAVGPCPDLEQY